MADCDLDPDRLPLRQPVAFDGPVAAGAFARQDLLDGLARPGRFRIARLDAGGLIHAAEPSALAEARELLQQVYGDLVRFGEPVASEPAGGAA